MKKNSKTRRNKRNRRYTKKRVGGKISRRFDILNWENLTVPERKAATMNVFANVSRDFMTRQGVTPPDQNAHLASILGLIYQHGFAKLPGDVTDDYEGAYQKALQPIDPEKISTSDISDDEFNQAYSSTLKNVEKMAKEEGKEQEFIDSNNQSKLFSDMTNMLTEANEKETDEEKKRIMRENIRENFEKNFPNIVRQKSEGQLEKQRQFLGKRKRKSMKIYSSPHLTSKEQAAKNRENESKRIGMV